MDLSVPHHPTRLLALYAEINNSVILAAEALIAQNRLTQQQALQDHAHDVMRLLAPELGLIYRRIVK